MRVAIFGASGGVGRALASKLANSAARLLLVHGPQTLGTPRWVDELREKCRDLIWVGGDLADVDVMKQAIESAEECAANWGALDGVVSCIGRAPDRRRIAEWDIAYVQRTIAENFSVPAVAIGKCAPLLRSPGGVVVFVGSVGGFTGSDSGSGAYCAAKAAIHGLVRTLTREMAPKGIRVIGVAPGLVDTAFHGERRRNAIDAAVRATAVGRIAAPEDIADSIAWLLTDEATFVWGTIVNVDGGLL